MTDHSRRKFLRTASIGAAGMGAVAALPVGAASATTPVADPHELDNGPAHPGSFTVWVKNADAGKLAVMVGESEIVYTDRKLAKRLARLAARAQQS